MNYSDLVEMLRKRKAELADTERQLEPCDQMVNTRHGAGLWTVITDVVTAHLERTAKTQRANIARLEARLDAMRSDGR